MVKTPRINRLRALFLVLVAWLASLRLVFVALHREAPTPGFVRAAAMAIRPQFVLFGDSLTQHGFDEGGWAARLACAYARKADVVLRGYSGYNLAWAQHLIGRVFPLDAPVKPALVTIFFGANDAALDDGVNSRQHVRLDDYALLLRKTIQHLREAGAHSTLLITPPPIDEAARKISRQQKWGVSKETEGPDRLNSVTGKYAAVCRAIGMELGVPVLDIWSEFQKDDQWRSYLSDGLHLTQRGNEALLTLLFRLIEEQLPHLRFDKLPFDFPLHDGILRENPGAAFQRS